LITQHSVSTFLPTGLCDPSNSVVNGFSRITAPVAQLDRASDFGSEGWGFKSLRAYNPTVQTIDNGRLSIGMTEDEKWMEFAVREAEQAMKRKDVPIGAVIIREARIIGKGYNQIETLKDPTAHAEIIAITAAASFLGNRRLEHCTMYVTLEPCAMCAGAIVLARIPRLVFGAFDPKAGACGTLYNIVQDSRLNHRAEVVGGILQERCGGLLSGFFQLVRGNGMDKP
jgi:tRNA(adenine34) deaminase